LSAQRSNSNTVWFNFQTYIFINIPCTFQWVMLQCIHMQCIWYAR